MRCEGSKKYCLPGHSPRCHATKGAVPHQLKMAEVIRAHIIFERNGAKPILQATVIPMVETGKHEREEGRRKEEERNQMVEPQPCILRHAQISVYAFV